MARFTLAPEVYFETNKEEDWTIVRVAAGAVGIANADWGSLRLATVASKKGDAVQCIQHPNEGVKMVSKFFKTVTQVNKPTISHDVDTEKGSSGAPLLNKNLEVVGIHHGSRSTPVGQTSPGSSELKINEASAIHGVLDRLAANPAPAQQMAPPPPRIGGIFGGFPDKEEIYPGYLFVRSLLGVVRGRVVVVQNGNGSAKNTTEHWFLYTKTVGGVEAYVWPGDPNAGLGASSSVEMKIEFQSATLPFTPGNAASITTFRNGLPAHDYIISTCTLQP
jgi:hypothetical protein